MISKAIWNGATLAESDKCVPLEGNQYFPADAIKSGMPMPIAAKTMWNASDIAICERA